MRHHIHRFDESGRPTDRSLLQDGYDDAPRMSGGAIRAALIILAVEAVAGIYYFFF